jgi:hypothetical protein
MIMGKNDHLAVRTHEKMMEVLTNPDAQGPKEHYYMIRGGTEMRNITVWEPGKVGDEYIKTYGHYHIGELDETYWFLLGTGVVLQHPGSMPGHADYEMVKQMRGFAYYIVERNGAPALIKNPLYKEIQKEDFGGLPVVES